MTEEQKHISNAKLKDKAKFPISFILKEGCITNEKISDDAVSTSKIQDKAVTPEKVSNSFVSEVVMPPVNEVDQKYQRQIDELYTLIRSYTKGGIALSNYFGDSEEFGITQKTISRYFKKVFDKLSEITGEVYTTFTMTVEPTYAVTEEILNVAVTLKMDQDIFPFDNIRIYVNDELRDETKGVEEYTSIVTVDNTSIIKAEVMIAGDTYTREETVTKYTPFFMGSGQQYTDIINEEHRIDYTGSIAGSYDIVVENANDRIFIITPISAEDQFKRVDMNGFEIPVDKSVVSEYVVYTSVNTYAMGTYNVDIEVNN